MNNNFTYPKHFIIGYGSIINDHSRLKTCNQLGNAIPILISKKLGYIREWCSHQQSTNKKLGKYTALGIRKVEKNKGMDFNGILYPICKKKIISFDKREINYKRIKINKKFISALSWQNIPNYNCNIWIYVPTKFNKPNKKYPINKYYLDLCIKGCKKYGEDFKKNFLNTIK